MISLIDETPPPPPPDDLLADMEPDVLSRPAPPRLQSMRLGDLVVPCSRIAALYRESVIDNYLRMGEVAVISGASKASKTWFAHSMAMQVAAGAPFIGMHVPKARRVMILDYELEYLTLRARLSLYAGPASEEEDNPAWVENVRVVSVREERKRTRKHEFGNTEDIRLLLEDARDAGEPVEFLLVDCLSRVPDMLDQNSENDNLEITRTMEKFSMLADEFGCAIQIMHHTAKGSGIGRDMVDRVRGGSAIAAVVETVASIVPDGGNKGWKQFEWQARTSLPQDILVVELDTACHPARWKLTNTDPLPAANNGQVVKNNRELIIGVLTDRKPGDEWLTTKKIGIVMTNDGQEINERTIRSQLHGLTVAGVVTSRSAGEANTKEYRLLTAEERTAPAAPKSQTAGQTAR